MTDEPQREATSNAPNGGARATLDPEDGFVTFVQIWELRGTDAQTRWLDVMYESIDLLRGKPGFVTMTLHPSLDGKRIAVYAQWNSRQELENAVSDPQAVAAHDRMAQLGESDGSLYTVARVYGPLDEQCEAPKILP